MMGFLGLSQVIHAAEDLLVFAGSDGPGDRVDALLKACDAIPGFLDGRKTVGGRSRRSPSDG